MKTWKLALLILLPGGLIIAVFWWLYSRQQKQLLSAIDQAAVDANTPTAYPLGSTAWDSQNNDNTVPRAVADPLPVPAKKPAPKPVAKK